MDHHQRGLVSFRCKHRFDVTAHQWSFPKPPKTALVCVLHLVSAALVPPTQPLANLSRMPTSSVQATHIVITSTIRELTINHQMGIKIENKGAKSKKQRILVYLSDWKWRICVCGTSISIHFWISKNHLDHFDYPNLIDLFVFVFVFVIFDWWRYWRCD